MTNVLAFVPSEFRDKAVKKAGGNVSNQILAIQKASQAEFEMNQMEADRTRRLIYWMNKNHPKGYRFRTMYEDGYLMVWRIR